MSLKLKVAALCAASFALFGCAEEKHQTERELQEKILDAYIRVNCPTAQKLESGLTILSLDAGTGTKPATNDGMYIHYNTYSLEGTCLSTTDSVKARMLGTYDPTIYYGPVLFRINSSSTLGMRELLAKMSKGGKAVAIIPPWLTVASGNTSSSYKGQQYSVNMLYEISAGVVISDIEKYQIDSLESYISKNFSPKIDSTSFGYYFRNFTHPSGIPAADTIEAETSVGIWYVGRLLDGYVFDTNIADTAKKYRIYDASKEYKPLSIKIKEKFEDMISDSDGSFAGSNESVTSSDSGTIEGFARAVKSMTYADKAVVLMTCDYGYGAKGNMSSGKGVPEYAMLRFDMWMAHESDTRFPPTVVK